jgi:hypothetical protein
MKTIPTVITLLFLLSDIAFSEIIVAPWEKKPMAPDGWILIDSIEYDLNEDGDKEYFILCSDGINDVIFVVNKLEGGFYKYQLLQSVSTKKHYAYYGKEYRSQVPLKLVFAIKNNNLVYGLANSEPLHVFTWNKDKKNYIRMRSDITQ